jgi:Ca-activated chloride channel family protein
MWPIARNRSPRAIALLSLASVAATTLGARQEPGVFRAATQTVPVFTTVIGPDGRLVTNLSRDDFEVYDDGKPQPITVFGNDVQPISIVVMLDTSGSMVRNVRLLREASVQLFTHLLPADKARVGSFGDRITVSPRFTNDANELIRWVWTELEAGGPTPLWGAVNVGMTALERLEGRKVVLVFTDGHDSSSRELVSMRDVVERAQSEGFMIYGIGFWSHGGRGAGPNARSEPPDPGVKTLAEETGGGYFELADGNNLGPAFRQVAEELHHQYLLGFSAARLDGRLHKLEVRLRQPGLTARARKSYLAQEAVKEP